MHCFGLDDASFRPYRRIVSARAMLIFCVNDEGIHVKKAPLRKERGFYRSSVMDYPYFIKTLRIVPLDERMMLMPRRG